jgi:hypothetical protein
MSTLKAILTLRMPLALALAFAACAFALPAGAALYKWTDSKGVVHYSDQPPIGDYKTEMVGKAPPPSNPNAVKEMVNKEAELKKRQLERVETANKNDKARADSAKLKEFCSQAAGQMMALQQTNVAIYRVNEKGERVFLEEADRRSEMARLEKSMREQNCPR